MIFSMANGSDRRAGGGWSFFFLVLTLGIILALLSIGVGGGASVRIPFTQINISAGGSIGKKEVVKNALPNYLQGKIADNNDFFNHSTTMTIWVAEGIGIIVVGQQPQAPTIDLDVNLLR